MGSECWPNLWGEPGLFVGIPQDGRRGGEVVWLRLLDPRAFDEDEG